MPQLYNIWMKNYPQPDININEEWEMDAMTLDKANRLINQMEKDYSDGCWQGHRMYQAKFYVLPIDRM